MRSSMQRKHSQQDTSYSADAMTNGDVPMQNFQEGLPPPPPVSHSWGRIERWLEDNYEELFENLGAGCTQNDLNELEHELDCSLPQDVRESIMIHDGQERGGLPTGVVFGCMLLDCEEIVQEWAQWRRTHEEYLREPHAYAAPQAPLKAFAGAASSSSSAASAPSHASTGSNWRAELNARQDSQPPNAIQKAYVHPAWIPMARDWGGNNICVDLAPASNGKWGQVILMGRDTTANMSLLVAGVHSWPILLTTWLRTNGSSTRTVANSSFGSSPSRKMLSRHTWISCDGEQTKNTDADNQLRHRKSLAKGRVRASGSTAKSRAISAVLTVSARMEAHPAQETATAQLARARLNQVRSLA